MRLIGAQATGSKAVEESLCGVLTPVAVKVAVKPPKRGENYGQAP